MPIEDHAHSHSRRTTNNQVLAFMRRIYIHRRILSANCHSIEVYLLHLLPEGPPTIQIVVNQRANAVVRFLPEPMTYTSLRRGIYANNLISIVLVFLNFISPFNRKFRLHREIVKLSRQTWLFRQECPVLLNLSEVEPLNINDIINRNENTQ